MIKTVFDPFNLSTLILFLCGLAFISCSQVEVNNKTSETQMNEEKLDIYLPAMYTGTLPCADCPGIKYRLIIEEDGFVEISTYRDRSLGRFEKTGLWSISGDTLTLIQSDNKKFEKKFLVVDQTLTLLTTNSQQIEGDLAKQYVLEQTANQPSIREYHQKLASQGFKYYAGGNEPFWSVKKDSLNHLIFETPDFTQNFSLEDSSKDGNQVILKASSESGKITLQAENNYCQDSMSGYLFPHQVTIIIQTEKRDTLSGCGLFLNS